MRSTSTHAYCRELHAWLKLQKALEEGVADKINEYRAKEELNAITARFLEKRFKKGSSQDNGALVILKTSEDLPCALSGSTLIIDPRPKNVKKDDIILIPEEMPCPVSWFFKAGLLAGVPFKTAKIAKKYHQGPLWFLETTEGLQMPVAFIMGLVVNILEPHVSLNQVYKEDK